MKIVIIGLCGHVNYVITALRKNSDLRLSAVTSAVEDDYNGEMFQLLNTEFDAPFIADWQVALDSCQPDIAVITSRFDLNGMIALECLKRGIHCFTEKNIAHSIELLRELKVVAGKNNASIIGIHGLRYKPEFFAAYKAVQNGVIGKPLLLNGGISYSFGCARPAFYKKRKTYGGTVLWLAVHLLDFYSWVAGDYDTVFAAHSRECNFNYGECEMSCAMTVTFKNGAMGNISGDFYYPKNSSITGGEYCRLAGSKGVLDIRGGQAVCAQNDSGETKPVSADEGDFFGDFCKSLQGVWCCRITMEETFKVAELALAARKSADTCQLERYAH